MCTLQLTAAWALIRVRARKSVVRTAIIAARFRDFILLDSHVATYSFGGANAPCFYNSGGVLSLYGGPVESGYQEEREHTAILQLRNPFVLSGLTIVRALLFKGLL